MEVEKAVQRMMHSWLLTYMLLLNGALLTGTNVYPSPLAGDKRFPFGYLNKVSESEVPKDASESDDSDEDDDMDEDTDDDDDDDFDYDDVDDDDDDSYTDGGPQYNNDDVDDKD